MNKFKIYFKIEGTKRNFVREVEAYDEEYAEKVFRYWLNRNIDIHKIEKQIEKDEQNKTVETLKSLFGMNK